jgi:ATP-dependent DNA helicase RecQ
MSNLLLWQLVYHLSGLTILGRTEQEPLGSLPISIRTAVLKTIDLQNPGTIELTLFKESLLFAEGEYEWVDSWGSQKKTVSELIKQQYNHPILHQLSERYSTYQKVAFTLIWQAVNGGQSRLKIADYQPTVAALALAVLDSLALIERVAELYGLPVELPEVDLYLVGSVDEFGVTQLMRYYRGAAFDETASNIDYCQTTVQLVATTELPSDVDFVSVAESLSYQQNETNYTFDKLEKFVLPFLDYVGNVPPLQARPVSFGRPTLDYFARRYFLVPELKPEQVELIQKALSNESCLGLLPTGFGKSLIYQLYALLIPRTTLVISPLRALIRDQVHNLSRPGLTCVESISSLDRTQAKKNEKLRLCFQEFRYRLLYITPERLQIKEFYDELKATMQNSPVGALVIDEAHCVSEWGHDFRPAYLQIERLQQALEEASGQPVPIIALTATASEPVRKDILRVLGLTSNSVVQLASSDRPELSLSVHSASEPQDKPVLLADLIQTIVPQVLSISLEELVPTNESPPYSHAGLIFGIYANSHGRSTIGEGVHHIAYELRNRLISDNSIIEVHASSVPDCCPKCGSSVMKDVSNKHCRCLECQEVFQESQTKPLKNWDKLIQQRQDDFQDNQFPLLVATKGYGMGIDKRNIRFVIHHSLSSSLEAYYQEAGRAGRDKQHAHVAMLYHAPHPKCKEEYIDREVDLQPPCVSNDHNFHFWKCPYFKDHLCDYGHQARFIRGHYPGLEEDVKSIMDIYRKLVAGENLTVKGDKQNKKTQLALSRLQQLEIVKEFSIKYHSLYQIEYQVEFDRSWSLPEVADTLKKILVQKDVNENYAKTQINQILVPFFSQSLENWRERALAEALYLIIGRIYETVPRMRYQMLQNQLDYARSHEEGTCRRVVLRSIFDSIDHLKTGNYKCNFCDVCIPDLQFNNEKATVLQQDAQVDEIPAQLSTLLQGFEQIALQEVLQFAIERGAVAGMFALVTNRLERDPTNLAALFLAGALARERQRETRAFDYLRFGFNEGIKQGLSPDNLLLFYEEGVLLQPKEAFEWLTQVGGYWDSEEGLKFLIQEAAQRFGTDSTHYRVLIVRWLLGRFNEVSDDCAAFKPTIEVIKNGFERLS